MAGLYLHIPFCKQACHYCDFYFSTSQTIRAPVMGGMRRELELQKNYLIGEVIETIYFGGGTPSLLSLQELKMILDEIAVRYPLAAHPEITLEANPDDLSGKKLEELRRLGINRLSIGIQSFDDSVL